MLGPRLECGDVHGQALALVPTLEEHLDACRRWLNDPAVTRYLTLSFGMNDAMERAWYEAAQENPRVVQWSIELGGRHIGQAGIEDIDWVCRTGTTGLFIGSVEHWRKGIATAVMMRRARFAFEQLNLLALFTEIFVRNEGSLRAAQRAGYVEYGRRPYARLVDGEFVDAWLGVLRRPEARNP